ncbi:MAG: hypothetical protein GW854_01660 [Erythrobacter sp.]|nr:hypothetical protein [Erythrobacter sp.]
MRTYDSPGDTLTIPVAPADFDLYPTPDLNRAIGEHVGVTVAAVDKRAGSVNLQVTGVHRRAVTSAEAETVANVKVYLDEDGDLTTDEAVGPYFGKVIGSLKVGANPEVLVRLG